MKLIYLKSNKIFVASLYKLFLTVSMFIRYLILTKTTDLSTCILTKTFTYYVRLLLCFFQLMELITFFKCHI